MCKKCNKDSCSGCKELILLKKRQDETDVRLATVEALVKPTGRPPKKLEVAKKYITEKLSGGKRMRVQDVVAQAPDGFGRVKLLEAVKALRFKHGKDSDGFFWEGK